MTDNDNIKQPDSKAVEAFMKSHGFEPDGFGGHYYKSKPVYLSFGLSEAAFMYKVAERRALEARIDELMQLNSLVTATEFHVPSRHKVYDYISTRKGRLAQLEGVKNEQ